jgi:ElaB/YqjD/DUF883 family membrane-anchored ribosome-binding protein
MALTKIEYGSLANSGTLNDNFDYLDDRISDLALLVATLQSNMSSIGVNANAQLEAKAAQLTSDMETMKKGLETDISNVNSAVNKVISNNGMYVTTTMSGTSWSREYFSDSAKTKRVWLEQGGVASSVPADTNTTITMPKSFSNTNYSAYATFRSTNWSSMDDAGAAAVPNAVNKLTLRNGYGANLPMCWMACGK